MPVRAFRRLGRTRVADSWLVLCAGLAFSVAPLSARAQQGDPVPAPAPIPAPELVAEPEADEPSAPLLEAEVMIDFDNVELVQLIKAMAKIVKKRFVYDDRVKGAVTIISQEPVTPAEAFRMFESVLQLKGYTIVEGTTGELKIIPSREVKQTPVAMLSDDGALAPRDVFGTRLVPLRYVKVGQIEGTLRQFASADASLIGDVRTNTLIVTDTGTNIARMMAIIAAIDVPLFEEQVKVLQLEYASATEMTSQLQEIFGAAGGAAAVPSANANAAQQQASLLR
jgi:general secretion pathway protein D